MNRPGIVITTFLTALAFTGTALADEYTPSEDANRRGIMVGIGLNGGHMLFEDADGSSGESFNQSYGGEVHVAYMVSKRLALSLEGWGMYHAYTNFFGTESTVSHVIATIGPQFWVLPRLWIRGGLGYARASWTNEIPITGDVVQGETENRPGVSFGLGLEVVSGPNFALDVQLRGGTGFYENAEASNVGVGVGLTWF